MITTVRRMVCRAILCMVCLSIPAVQGAPGEQPPANILLNGGFEKTNPECMPANWSVRSQGRVRRIEFVEYPPQIIEGVLVSPVAARSGHFGLVMEARMEAPRFIVQQSVVVERPEAWHTFRAWARTEGDNPARTQLEVYSDTYGPCTLSREVFLTPDWREISISFIPEQLRYYDKGKKALWLRLVGWPHMGRVFWDDASLTLAERDEGRDPQKVMDNPNWEEGILRMQLPSPTLAGQLVIGRPTLEALHFQWPIVGDFNRNGRVTVVFRKHGETTWREGLPFLRLMHEVVNRVYRQMDYVCPNGYAGSIFPLEPGTAYDVHLTLSDPDGGGVEREVTVSTRALPAAFDKGRTLHVYPPGTEGPRQTPAFNGLMAAYAQSQPGDILLVHAGRYVTAADQLKDGYAYVFDKGGTPDKPVIIRGAGDGEALFYDGGSEVVFALRSNYLHIEDIAVEGAFKTAIQGEDNQGCVIRRCHISGNGSAIVVRPLRWEGYSLTNGGYDYLIADNVLTGPLAEHWGKFNEYNLAQGGYSRAHKPSGVVAIGQGHVISHNRIRGYFDGMSTGGFIYRDEATLTRCIEIHHNLIEECVDDGIELDGAMGNILFHHNAVTRANSAVSAQPLYGGPAYVFRNVAHDIVHAPCKLSNWPAGLLIANNTFITKISSRSLAAIWQNTRFFNNIDMGASAAGGGPIRTGMMTPQTSAMDNNGYRFTGKPLFWAIFGMGSHMWPQCDYRRIKSPDEFVRLSGQERHAVWDLSFKDFMMAGEDFRFDDLDLRLQEGSKAIDAGTLVPQITDGYTGRAPDLGAYERGTPEVIFGPRKMAPVR